MIGSKRRPRIPNSHCRGTLLGCLLGASLLCLIVGCSSQPRVSSPEAMDLIKLAYTACNTKNDQRLAAAESRFQELVAEGLLSKQEQEAFQEILDLARDGNWQKAQDRAFSFAKSQTQ